MSKTIRRTTTKGWLEKLQRMRKERKEARDLKADKSLFELDIYSDELFFTSYE